MRFSTEVDTEDIDEAIRLIEVSKSSVEYEAERKVTDVSTKIFIIIRNAANKIQADVKSLKMDTVKNLVYAAGYTENQLNVLCTKILEMHTRLYRH